MANGQSVSTSTVRLVRPDGAYNAAGGLQTETYPSGRTVKTCFDVAGRLKRVIQTLCRGDGVVERHHGFGWAGLSPIFFRKSVNSPSGGRCSRSSTCFSRWASFDFPDSRYASIRL